MSDFDHDRVRRSYDAVAHEYSQRYRNELAYKPLDRALLAALMEGTPGGSTVADLGCGPGHVAAHLADYGVSVVGIDLSPTMIEIARARYPAVEFRVGDLLALPAPERAFGALVAFYSIIHLDDSEAAAAFEEMRRVLEPDGRILLSFHAGSEVQHVSEAHGRQVDLDFHFLVPDTVADRLEQAGFLVEALLERVSYPEEVETRRAYLLAQRR